MDQVLQYSRALAARYGNLEPWVPHKISAEEQHCFCQNLLAEVSFGRAQVSVSKSSLELLRGCLRIINLPEFQPERRALLHSNCLLPLLAAGVDASFHDGCVGRKLPLDMQKLRCGGVQKLHYDGIVFTIDTTLWKENWTAQELANVEHRMAMLDWFPLAWLAFPKDVMEPQTPGFVGGHISHVAVWREAWEADLDYVMVLEDDATPNRAYGITWLDIWNVVTLQVTKLKARSVEWDILYVGHTPSYTREGEDVTPLIRRAGYCLRTHAYCLSREGLWKLLNGKLATTITHRPQDEVLASLTLISNGLYHPREDFDAMLRDLAADIQWRPLLFKFDGLSSPLEDVEDSARSRSDTAPFNSARASGASGVVHRIGSDLLGVLAKPIIEFEIVD